MSMAPLLKKYKFSILSFLVFTITHPFAVLMTISLLSGWQDVEIIGGLLGMLLIVLMPLLLLGQKVAFLGVGVYVVSALIWGFPLSFASTLLFNLHKKIIKNNDITRPRQ